MKKINAFTLAETIIVFIAIGIIATLTLSSGFDFKKLKGDRLESTTRAFFTNINGIFQEIIIKESTNGVNIKGIKELTDEGANSNTLATMLNIYLQGEIARCDNSDFQNLFKSGNSKENFACIYLKQGVIAAIYYEKKCDINNLEIKNYYEPKNTDTITLTSKNICGYITYGLEDTTGDLGKNLFRIAFDKKGIIN